MKISGMAVFLLAAAVLAVIVMKDNADRGVSVVPDPPKRARAPLDVNRPVYTTASTPICPTSILRDNREGRGLRAATDAATSIIGRESAVAIVGCELWRAGIQVYVDTDPDQRVWKFFREVPMPLAQPKLVFADSLTNNPKGTIDYIDQVAAEPKPGAPAAASEPVAQAPFVFRCPEDLAGEAEQKAAVAASLEHYAATTGGKVTMEGFIAFRRQLLVDHHCQKTLDHLAAEEAAAEPASAPSEGASSAPSQ